MLSAGQVSEVGLSIPERDLTALHVLNSLDSGLCPVAPLTKRLATWQVDRRVEAGGPSHAIPEAGLTQILPFLRRA